MNEIGRVVSFCTFWRASPLVSHEYDESGIGFQVAIALPALIRQPSSEITPNYESQPFHVAVSGKRGAIRDGMLDTNGEDGHP